jgi:hypothetical protein
MALNLHKWEKLTVQNHANTTKSCFMEMVRCNATSSYRASWLLSFESLSYRNHALRKLLIQRLLGCFWMLLYLETNEKKNKTARIRCSQTSHLISLIQSLSDWLSRNWAWDTKLCQNIQKTSHAIVLVRMGMGKTSLFLHIECKAGERGIEYR